MARLYNGAESPNRCVYYYNWELLIKARWRSLFRRERIASTFLTGFDALTD
ncbi:hypothetical protein MC7420_5909 [Coleofasciculus chthonoplastes PCC 7420]|uniref:Uncharacterized protein n=1 Tax=Coleofasciculus chthonoplastes PCC 7420 TaxID=118168 RepID=B4VVP3_9CYAN|nr:hypothetical protein [Coleofasciculus chthonoplastes]EDX74029.1 hypothetical protein MC7420_5909 [Coleofasciculus chthonoplastes PCC 7420]